MKPSNGSGSEFGDEGKVRTRSGKKRTFNDSGLGFDGEDTAKSNLGKKRRMETRSESKANGSGGVEEVSDEGLSVPSPPPLFRRSSSRRSLGSGFNSSTRGSSSERNSSNVISEEGLLSEESGPSSGSGAGLSSGSSSYFGDGNGAGLVLGSPSGRRGTKPQNPNFSSASSNAEVSSKQRGQPASYIRTPQGGVIFRISGRIEGVKGDHSTSHLAIIHALMSIAESGGIRAACVAMKKFGEATLEDEYKEELLDIVEPKVRKSGDRKKVPDFLLAIKKRLDSQNLSPEKRAMWEEELAEHGISKDELDTYAKEISDDLKYAKVCKLAQHLCDLAACVLSGLSQHSLATFHSRGRTNQKTNHSDLTKGGARALVALDAICGLCSDDILEKDFLSQLEFFIDGLDSIVKGSGKKQEDHIMRYGLNRWYQDGGTKADELKENLQQNLSVINGSQSSLQEKEGAKTQALNSLKEIRDELLSRDASDKSTPSTSDFIGNLLDYNKVIKCNLKEATDTDGKNKKKDINTQKNIIQSIFSSEDHKITYQKNNQGGYIASISRISKDNLIIVLSRHLQIISAAFPSLDKVIKDCQVAGVENQEGEEEQRGGGSNDERMTFLKSPIIAGFLQHEVLNKGWDSLKYKQITDTVVVNKKINLDDLQKAISKKPHAIFLPASARKLGTTNEVQIE